MEKIDQSCSAEQESEAAMHLSLQVKPELMPIFFDCGTGFQGKCPNRCSVKELLCDQLGIDEDYLEKRIQTIFLNAKWSTTSIRPLSPTIQPWPFPVRCRA